MILKLVHPRECTKRNYLRDSNNLTDLFSGHTGDIEPKSNSSAPANSSAWTRSDNSFRFNFLPDAAAAPPERARPQGLEQAPCQIHFTKGKSAFAFNFQIPAAESPQDIEMAESPEEGSVEGHSAAQADKPSTLQEVNAPPEPQLKANKKKKKKKSGKPKESGDAEAQQEQTKGSQGSQDTELSAEEQLNRQLDWCIEQLEHGLRSQKGTPKQKEEAARALKTLRSSKAPLVKKRQVMRSMAGEYRKKMEEEKNKQFKLIKSEMTTAQVKVVSDSPKMSVFHRKAKVKTQSLATEDDRHESLAPKTDVMPGAPEEMSSFVLTPSNEEFRFNFL